MGTTTTSNLALIKPDVNESIKEDLPTFPGWADQNADNCDVIDGLFRASTHTYTPTWGASTTPPVLGSGGFIEGKWVRLFPRMVFGQIRLFAGGAGFSAGSGTYNLSLPVAIPPEFATFFNAVVIGKAIVLDNDNVLNTNVMAAVYDIGASNMILKPPNGSSWTNAFPFTVAQNDRVSLQFSYPTAAA